MPSKFRHASFCTLESPVILRRHGAALDHWAHRIETWARASETRDAERISRVSPPRTKRDVFCYFDNDQKIQAPFDAQRLKQLLESVSVAVHKNETSIRRVSSAREATGGKEQYR